MKQVDPNGVENLFAAARSGGIQLEVKETYSRNDDGNAERFVARRGEDLRYVPGWKQWLIWNGQYWAPDELDGVARRGRLHAREMLQEASRIEDENRRGAEVRAALKLGNLPKLTAMLEFAQNDPRVAIPIKSLNTAPYLAGVKNGVVDLATGAYRPGQREDYITKTVGTEYLEGASCPTWVKFLHTILGGDTQLIRYVQKAVGYTLTGSTREHCFFFLYGCGSNGKSTFIETLQALLGEYGQRAPQCLFTTTMAGRAPETEIARLAGARLIVGSETEDGSRWAESRIKDLTGGDTLSGWHLYQRSFQFKPALKLWLFGNHKPEVRGVDHGMWRRVRLLPFTVQIADHQKDRDLPQKLLAELPGILNWAIEGCRLWQREGLEPPAAVLDAVQDYQSEEDTLGRFLEEWTTPVAEGLVKRTELFKAYEAWCEAEGIKYPFSHKGFCKKLRERPGRLIREVKSNGVRYWGGITLGGSRAVEAKPAYADRVMDQPYASVDFTHVKPPDEG